MFSLLRLITTWRCRICGWVLRCSAVVAERRRLLHGARSYRSISPQQTRRTPLLLSIDGTDRQTDVRPLHRPCCGYYTGSVYNPDCLVLRGLIVPFTTVVCVRIISLYRKWHIDKRWKTAQNYWYGIKLIIYRISRTQWAVSNVHLINTETVLDVVSVCIRADKSCFLAAGFLKKVNSGKVLNLGFWNFHNYFSGNCKFKLFLFWSWFDNISNFIKVCRSL